MDHLSNCGFWPIADPYQFSGYQPQAISPAAHSGSVPDGKGSRKMISWNGNWGSHPVVGAAAMQRFELYQKLLALRRERETAPDEPQRTSLLIRIRAMEGELAVLDASTDGASLDRDVSLTRGRDASEVDRQFWQHFETSDRPYLLLDPGPGLKIVDVNDAYARVTMIDRAAVAGQRLFDVFPDNTGDGDADGVSNLFQSLRSVAITGRPDHMAIQRYDIRDQGGQFVERYWQSVNTPIFDENKRLIYLLHWVEDVTEQALSPKR